MAEEGIASSIFPPPPPFFQHFTEKNLERLKELREARIAPQIQIPGLNASNVLDLPPELRYLVPPEPPKDGVYHSFGDKVDVHDPLPMLKDHEIEQLYPESAPEDHSNGGPNSQWTLDRAFYLKKMARSIILGFLDLVGILQRDPTQYEEKIRQIATLVFNAHQLINEYRPHQARESLIIMMEEQLEKKRKDIESVKGMKSKVAELLGGIERDGADGGVAPGIPERVKKVDAEEVWKREQRAVWAALEELV